MQAGGPGTGPEDTKACTPVRPRAKIPMVPGQSATSASEGPPAVAHPTSPSGPSKQDRLDVKREALRAQAEEEAKACAAAIAKDTLGAAPGPAVQSLQEDDDEELTDVVDASPAEPPGSGIPHSPGLKKME